MSYHQPTLKLTLLARFGNELYCLLKGKMKKKMFIVLNIRSYFTFSLFSFLLTMTAVICWSRKIKMVDRRAGIPAAR